MIGGALFYVINAAIPFTGELKLVAVPLCSDPYRALPCF